MVIAGIVGSNSWDNGQWWVVYPVAYVSGEIFIFPAGQTGSNSHHRSHQLLSNRRLHHSLVFSKHTQMTMFYLRLYLTTPKVTTPWIVVAGIIDSGSWARG